MSGAWFDWRLNAIGKSRNQPQMGWDRHYIVDLSQMQIQSKYADVFHSWHEVTRAAMARISFKRMTVEQSRW